MSYEIGDIIHIEEYTDAVTWCCLNNATLKEIEPDEQGRRFQIIEIVPYTPTKEEVKAAREIYRREHMDSKTAERSRRMANGTWTSADEEDYLQLDIDVTAYIEEHFPYPAEAE